MRNILWIFSLLGALGGGWTLIEGLIAAQSAPQQAAAAAMAVGYAVIPYCMARAWSELAGPPKVHQPNSPVMGTWHDPTAKPPKEDFQPTQAGIG